MTSRLNLDPSESPRALLRTMRASPVHTVQWQGGKRPPCWEVIYTGTGPFPNEDPRCGDLEATIYVERDGLRVEVPHV